MSAEMMAGSLSSEAGTFPAGQAGLFSSDASDNEISVYRLRDLSRPKEIDGRWFTPEHGFARYDDSGNGVLRVESESEKGTFYFS